MSRRSSRRRSTRTVEPEPELIEEEEDVTEQTPLVESDPESPIMEVDEVEDNGELETK